MFLVQHLGRVNADWMDEYPPETLLVLSLGRVMYKAIGWNHVENVNGTIRKIEPAVYPTTNFTEEMMEGVTVGTYIKKNRFDSFMYINRSDEE